MDAAEITESTAEALSGAALTVEILLAAATAIERNTAALRGASAPTVAVPDEILLHLPSKILAMLCC